MRILVIANSLRPKPTLPPQPLHLPCVTCSQDGCRGRLWGVDLNSGTFRDLSGLGWLGGDSVLEYPSYFGVMRERYLDPPPVLRGICALTGCGAQHVREGDWKVFGPGPYILEFLYP